MSNFLIIITQFTIILGIYCIFTVNDDIQILELLILIGKVGILIGLYIILILLENEKLL